MKNILPKREEIQIRDRVLKVCSHGECESNRVWDFPTCWQHLTVQERQGLIERLASCLRDKKELKGIVLTGANLSGMDFTGTDLSEAFLNHCNLSNCKLIDANLMKAFLQGANFENADLTRTNIMGAVFTHANLFNVKLLAYSFTTTRPPINLSLQSFGSQRVFGRQQINESVPYFAEPTYRALKSYFVSNGDYDGAGWASYCERLMQQVNYRKKKQYLQWFPLMTFNILCGYGEKPYRVIAWSSVMIFAYAIAYRVFGLIIYDNSSTSISWIDSLSFSMATFCTLTFPDLLPINDSIARFVMASEAFCGIFSLGLFVFTLTKKYVSR